MWDEHEKMPMPHPALTDVQEPMFPPLEAVAQPAPKPLRLRKLKIGRNVRCLCGSGRKFKHCCIFKHPPYIYVDEQGQPYMPRGPQ